jgi:hypothetical protein
MNGRNQLLVYAAADNSLGDNINTINNDRTFHGNQ